MHETLETIDSAASYRVFIAVPLPEETQRLINDVRERLMKGFVFTTCRPTWVKPGSMHLTTRFLGDTPGSVIPELIDRLALASEGLEPVRLKPKGIDVFPHWRAPKVLWVGIEDLTGTLAWTVRLMEEQIRDLGFAAEPREFHPHVTLARFKSMKGIEAGHKIVNSHRLFAAPIFIANELVLYCSALTPEGPQYRRIHAFTAK